MLMWIIYLHIYVLTFDLPLASSCGSLITSLADSAFSATTSATSSAPENAKWGSVAGGNNSYDAWLPDLTDANPYIQIDLSSPNRIEKIVTRGESAGPFYTASYRLEFSFDLQKWVRFPETNAGTVKTFSGNQDATAQQDNTILTYAQYLRLYPVSCSSNGQCAVKLDVEGCQCTTANGITSSTITNVEVNNLLENFVYLHSQSSTTVEYTFTLSGGNDLVVIASLDTGDTLLGNIDVSAKTATVYVKSDDFPDLGTFLLTTEIKPCTGTSETKKLVVYHEEEIQGFHVTTDNGYYVPLAEEVEFLVTMTSGSNVQMEWMIDHNFTTCLEEYPGRVRNASKIFTFPENKEYNMTVFARNYLKPVYKIFTITALRRVTNFTVTTTEGLFNTRQDLYFNVSNTLTTAELNQMGDVYLEIIYGNGLNDSFLLNSEFDSITQNISTYIAKYMIQGNYTLIARVSNKIDFQEFHFTFYAWDSLNVSLVSEEYVTIGEPFLFTFENPPLAAFQYRIDYGNGKNFETNESIWYTDFSIFTWQDYNYTSPGVFDLYIVMWNPFNVIVQSFTLTAQHPIPPMTLYPTFGDFPSPDNEASFTLTMNDNKPSPTNVTCTFSFKDYLGAVDRSESVKYPVLFSYANPYQIAYEYEYDILGQRNVTFSCSNLVSNMFHSALITIRTYTIDDFEVLYPHTVPMNMSFTGNGTDIDLNPLGIYAIPETVTFLAKLYNMVVVPKNLKFEWLFDDGSTYTHDPASVFEQTHEFTSRRLYTGHLEITDNVDLSSSIVPISVQMGAVNFTANAYDGSPGKDTFTFTAFGLEGTATYDFDLKNKEQVLTTNGGTVTLSTVYHIRGQYVPVLTATNGSFIEVLHPPRHIGVDYVFNGINWTMSSVVPLPTGEVEISFAIPDDGDPVLDITCSFTSGDRIDKAIHYQTTNMSSENPIIFNYTYLTLGKHFINTRCANYNNRDSWTNGSNILVYNHCYSINGVFDRQYSNRTTPMVVLTSKDIDLASRMLVYCPEKNPQYIWRYFNISEIDYSETEFVYTPAFVPKGSVRFMKGSMPEGLYKISLNVSLEDTWIQEYTFVRFKKPPPYAFIVKGSKRMAAIDQKFISIDGLTESYDAQQGYGYNQALDFTWFCNIVQTSTLDDLDSRYTSYGGYTYYMNNMPTPCNTSLSVSSQSGIVTLNVTSHTPLGYVVTVRVHKDGKEAFFTQLIQSVIGDPPDISIVCSINCLEKYAVTSPLSVKVVCNDCLDPSDITYSWFLQKLDNGTYVEVDLENITLTATTLANFVLRPNVLVPGYRYTLSVDVKAMGRENALGVMDLVANYPPYNGTCESSPKTGNASTTKYGVYCSGWLDEGEDFYRSDVKDLTRNEPLIYEYISFVQISVGEYSSVPLFKGSESTATELTLSVGYNETNYETEIEIRIYDRYGDYAVFRSLDTMVQVVPDEEMVPTDLNDTSSLDKLFDTFDTEYNRTEAGGNNMAVVRLVGATTSLYQSAGLRQEETSVSDDDILSGNVDPDTVDLETHVSPVQESLQVRTRMLTGILLTAATADSTDTSSQEQSSISAADVRQVAKSLSSCISNPLYVDDVSIENAAAGTEVLMKNIRLVSKSKPFPVEDINNINDASAEVVGAVDKIFDMILPDEVEETVPTVDTILEEFQTYTFYNGNDNNIGRLDEDQRRELATKMLRIKLKKREKQLKCQNNAVKNFPKMRAAIHDTLLSRSKLTQAGAGVNTLNKTNIKLTVEKETVQTFQNKTLKRSDVKLSIDLDNMQNTAEEVELWVSSYTKQPYIYASGASQISSNAVNISTRNSDEQEINLPRTVHFSNSRYASFKHYYAANISDGIDPMFYFVTDLVASDSVLVYIMPDDVDFADLREEDMYNAYLSLGDYPTSESHSFMKSLEARDWEDPYGFKVFVPSGTFSAGRVYIGLKPKTIAPTQNQDRRRRKRSICTSNCTTSDFNPIDSNFSIAIVTTGCRSYDEAQNAWVDTGCRVLDLSTINETVCFCDNSPSNTFASTFYVPPNTIDFHAVWSKFDPTNAAVYGTLIALLVVYFLALPWFRRQDGRDLDRWATLFLCDSEISDSYFYLLSVQTGLRRESGTTSNVNFIVGAEHGDTGVRVLSDGFTKGFEAGSFRTFLMGTPVPLGELTYFRLWHDNSGLGDMRSWYLHKIMVDDLQTKRRYVFMCDKWLAVEQDDGMIERVLPVCSKDALTSYDQLISQHARFNATENHLWLSMIIRPQRSNFTRVQRLSSALALLFLTMIASAMFYRDSSEVQPSEVSIGILRFSLTSLYTSFMSILIATVPMICITMIFRKSRKPPKKDAQSRLRESLLQKLKRNKSDNMSPAEKKLQSHYVDFLKETEMPLPHWAVYIAWFLLSLAVVTSAFFLILYSMEWGKSKSETWLSTFFLSFLESIFVMDPLNVILMAVLIALVIRKPVDNDSPDVDMGKIKEAAQNFGSDPSRSYMTFRMQVLSKQGPPEEVVLEGARKQREQEVQAQAVFRRLIIYAIFVFVVFSISYINRDARSFNLKRSLDGQLYESSIYTLGFQNVNTTLGLFQWLQYTLFPRYFPETYYNGDSLPVLDKLYFGDLENVRIGPGRLRQVRMRKVTCKYIIDDRHPCVEKYDEDEEDNGNYCIGWERYNSSCAQNAARFTTDGWVYKSADDIWGMSYMGRRAFYGGGGYVVTFDINQANSISILNELSSYAWIDRQTRAVFFEFTLYNPNINLFMSAIYLTEFLPTGGILTWMDLQSFRPYQALGAIGAYALICYFIYFIFLIVSIVRMIIQVRKEGKSFFKKTWNLVDLLCIVLGITGIVLWALRLKYSNDALDRYYNSRTTFVTFHHIVYWDNAFVIVMAIITFIATIRILQILGYNRRMTQLVEVIAGAGPDLSSFALVFGIVYFAYVITGYLLFGANVKGYRSVFVAFGSLTNSIIGKNHLDIITSAGPLMAELYYFTYILIVILILISMFAVILNQSISTVRQEIQQEKVYGLTNVIADSFKDIFGSLFRFPRRKNDEHEVPKALKYQSLSTRKPDFDAPNIVDLLQEILKQHGGETQMTKTEKQIPKIQIDSGRSTPQPLDLTIDLPDYRPRPSKPLDSTEDVQLTFDERDASKVSNVAAFL